MTDVRAAEGSQYLAQAPLTTINISIADPSATFTLHSLSLGIFLQSPLSELRPGLNGQVRFSGGIKTVNGFPIYDDFQSVNYIAPIPGSLANFPVKLAGIVVLGIYQMMPAAMTKINDVKWLTVGVGETTLSNVIDVLGAAGLTLGGLFLDNVTYSITTPT